MKSEQTTVRVRPFASDRIEYLSADREETFTIAQANSAPRGERLLSGRAH